MTGQDEHPFHHHRALLWSLFLPYHEETAAKVHPLHFQRGFLGVLPWQLELVQGNEYLYISSGAGCQYCRAEWWLQGFLLLL